MTSTPTGRATVRVVKDTYCDSLKLLVATGTMAAVEGVEWAGAVMGTAAGLAQLADSGIVLTDTPQANDLVLAVVAEAEASAESALAAGIEAVYDEGPSAAASGHVGEAPRTVERARAMQGDANVAVVSVPGEYASLEAHHALASGLHVLLFSDNVSIGEERELKQRARDLGLLMMGPGAGTAVLSGTGLGFSNALVRGPVGVVAAAGTGAQEVSTLLSRWRVGVSQVIGVGGRDLSADVGGLMAMSALRALDADPDTTAVIVVSKPPDPDVGKAVLAACGATPTVAVFLGQDAIEAPAPVEVARTLEEGAMRVAELAGGSPGVVTAGLREWVASKVSSLGDERRTVRGYFSGGTLCYEAQLVLGEHLGAVHSNEPLAPARGLPAPAGSHVLLDLGAEEYTRGRPHPMIDPSARVEVMRSSARDPEVAVVLLDVVLGHGSHHDPAGELVGVCDEIMADGGPLVVAHVLGSEDDPQGYAEQRAKLDAAGCLVTETAARAAYAAAAIASRNPELTRR
jgi:FdrA protein